MDQRKLMEPLKLAGKLIMENGGETYRVEETVCRMGKAFGLKEVESFAVPSGVFVSFACEDGSIQTTVLRVHRAASMRSMRFPEKWRPANWTGRGPGTR